MDSNTIGAGLLALALSFLICLLILPKKKSLREEYIEVLDSNTWKNYDVIYQEVLRRSKRSISENEHDQILYELESDEIVEVRALELEIVEEIIISNEMGRSHVDQVGGYTTLLMYEYRLICDDSDGGKPIRKYREMSPALNLSSSHT